MTLFLEIAALFLTALSAALYSAWRRERKASAARDQLWRNALNAVVARDYDGAGAFAAMIEDDSGESGTRRDGKPLFITLRHLMRTIESLEIAEREQQRARRGFEDVLSALQDGVLVVDREARLRYLNSAAVGFFEVRVEDVLGAQLLEALPSFGLDAGVRSALEEGKHTAREVHLYSPRPREIFLRVSPVRQNDGSVTGAVAILQDLTEMRRLERVRRDFVANASHELRTPIATIRATAETIADAADDPKLIRRFLPHLISEAERISRLISDLLDLAKAESSSESSESLSNAPVDLCALTKSVMAHLADKAGQNNVSVAFEEPDAAENLIVKGDAAAIEQVIFNLLDNSLIYTPAAGSVTLKVDAAARTASQSEAAKTGSFVVFSVQDTGIGIPTGDLARVFERFYRVDKARSRAQGGTGLGLAIVKHIVENHDGYLELESEVGQGTVFRVFLPSATP